MPIAFYTFGTYYKKGSPAEGPNADAHRRFVFQVKNKYWPGGSLTSHPAHPAAQTWITEHAHALDYLVDMVQHNLEEIRYRLDLDSDPLQFIPIPSSDVTRATIFSARWSGRDVVQRLAARGLGQAFLPVVCRQTGISKEGLKRDPTFAELVANYEVLGQLNPHARIVYFDDVITWGTHLAAMQHVLGAPDNSCALGVARTDGKTFDAFERRLGHVVGGNGGHKLECLYGDVSDPEHPDPPSDDDPW